MEIGYGNKNWLRKWEMGNGLGILTIWGGRGRGGFILMWITLRMRHEIFFNSVICIRYMQCRNRLKFFLDRYMQSISYHIRKKRKKKEQKGWMNPPFSWPFLFLLLSSLPFFFFLHIPLFPSLIFLVPRIPTVISQLTYLL